MLLRLLLVVVLAVIALAWLRHWRSRRDAGPRVKVIDRQTTRCAHCAVYFPRAEAVVRDGQTYCSAAHAERERA